MVARRDTARHLNVQCLVAATVAHDELAAQAVPVGRGDRVVHVDGGEAVREAGDVLLEAKRAPVEHRDHLVHRIPEDETAIEH